MVIKIFLKPPNKQGWGETERNPRRPARVQSVRKAMRGYPVSDCCEGRVGSVKLGLSII